MKIYLDFDGTVVEHQYPSIGSYNMDCFEVIEKLYLAGHQIILNTYRANCNDGTLQEAINYLTSQNQIGYISKILKKKKDPAPWNWVAHQEQQVLFIDDIGKGIPLKETATAPYDIVDWLRLDKEFESHGLYEKTNG